MHEKKVSITMTLRDKATARVKKLRSMLSLAGTTGKKAFRSVSTGAHIANAALQQAKVRTSLLTGAFARMRLMSAGAFAKIATMSKSVFGGMLNIVKGAFGRITALVGRMVHKVLNGIKLLSLAFVGLSVASVKMAADVGESENLFEVSMGAMAKSTREWSDQLATQLHLNAYAIRRYVGTFNVMLKSMGIGTQEAASMSKAMTQLSMDISSFYNVGLDEAMQKIQSGITGEAEPLKRLGILVNETTVKTWALNHGLIAQKQELSEVQKVLGRYGVIMEATNAAQGDMARTANSPQNIFKAIGAQLKILMIKWGEGFLPMVERTGPKLRTFFEDSRGKVTEWGKTVADKVEKVKDIMGLFFTSGDNWTQRWRALWNAMLEIMMGTTRAAVQLAIVAGKGIWKGIQQGLLDRGTAAKAEFKKMGGRLYSQTEWMLDPNRKNLRQVSGRIGLGTANYIRKSDAEKWAAAERRALERTTETLIGSAFTGIVKTLDESWTKALAEIGKLGEGEMGRKAKAIWDRPAGAGAESDQGGFKSRFGILYLPGESPGEKARNAAWQERHARFLEKAGKAEEKIKTTLKAQLETKKEILQIDSASAQRKFAPLNNLQQPKLKAAGESAATKASRALTEAGKTQQVQTRSMMEQFRRDFASEIGRLTEKQQQMVGNVDLFRNYADPQVQKYMNNLLDAVMQKWDKGPEQQTESAATKASRKLTEAGSVLLQAGKALLRSAGQGNALAREANAARVGVGVG